MPFQVDDFLIRREQNLPGVATILNPGLLLKRLHTELPEAGVAHLQPLYIRYKPGMNCIAGYRLVTSEKEVDIYAKAHGPDAAIKIRNAESPKVVPGPLGVGRIILKDIAVTLSFFPNDFKLSRLRRLNTPESRRRLLQRLGTNLDDSAEVLFKTLAYKPERRYVALVHPHGHPGTVLKFYTPSAYQLAVANAMAFSPQDSLRVARLSGCNRRYNALAFHWLEGEMLTEIIRSGSQARWAVVDTGKALALLHTQYPENLGERLPLMEARMLRERAEWLKFVHPAVGELAENLANKLAIWLNSRPQVRKPIHGDFYAKQVLWSEGRVGIIDFDEAVLYDPAADIGSFIAHLHRDGTGERMPQSKIAVLEEEFLKGYLQNGGIPPAPSISVHTAVELFKLSHGPFRTCEPNWKFQTEALLEQVQKITERALPEKAVFSFTQRHAIANGGNTPPVSDPLSVTTNATMPFAQMALNPATAAIVLEKMLYFYSGFKSKTNIKAIRVLRHKPGRRCLMEYQLTRQDKNGHPVEMKILGKGRAKGLDHSTHRLAKLLWESGFHSHSSDGISIPEPIGAIREFNMWFQKKVPGSPATEMLTGKQGVILAKRIAAAIHKVHRVPILPVRYHSMAGELRILHQRLMLLARQQPQWEKRLYNILNDSIRLSASIKPVTNACIHRDFYSDQVLVAGERLYLLDFDLFCLGDPALDVGNFSAHITEQSLRNFGDPQAMETTEFAFENEYLKFYNEDFLKKVQVYKTLTLVRHISISQTIPGRKRITADLISLCEERLAQQLNRNSRKYSNQLLLINTGTGGLT